MAESDRRHFPRQNEETAIQVLLAPDHSNGRKDTSYDLLPAKLCNQSEEGFYIEIDHSLQAGSTLSIKMTSYLGRLFIPSDCVAEAQNPPRWVPGISRLVLRAANPQNQVRSFWH